MLNFVGMIVINLRKMTRATWYRVARQYFSSYKQETSRVHRWIVFSWSCFIQIVGDNRSPISPSGVIGSTSDTQQHAIYCVSISQNIEDFGGDIEEYCNASQCLGVSDIIANDSEKKAPNRFRISAKKVALIWLSPKQKFFKAVYLNIKQYLNSDDAEIIAERQMQPIFRTYNCCVNIFK